MSKTLKQIAEQLKDADKKVQLIYAFNSTGKTRLSREMKELVAPKNDVDDGAQEQPEYPLKKILYYNAFTEDLFFWDNDLDVDAAPKLKIQPNSFTNWILKDQGQDQNIIANFQRYASDKLTPRFNKPKDDDGGEFSEADFSDVTFSLKRGDDTTSGDIKISKGEESVFIWSVFYALLVQVIDILKVVEPIDRETNQFDHLEYVFIDDPVSSLDENHLIELAVNLAALIKESDFTKGEGLKFVITTHNPLFYKVLYSELGASRGYILRRFEDGSFELDEKIGDSNKSFSYHLYLKQTLEQAIASNQIEKYHFTLLRNLYEKTAGFLGYKHWSDLLPNEGKEGYLRRIVNFSSHRTLSNEEVAELTEPEKQIVQNLLKNLIEKSGYWKPQEESDG
jgi:hypothetical protein